MSKNMQKFKKGHNGPIYFKPITMCPHDQGIHQNTPIIKPTSAIFVSKVNNEVIH